MSENIIACNLTFEDINKLAERVENGKLSKIKIKNGDCEVVIEKESKIMPPMPMPPMGVSVNTAAAVQPAASAESTAKSAEQLSGNIVKAPIVGTYYAAPGPDKAPFVEVGKKVKKGDVLMIIESMKLMNEVQSDFDGVVKEILIQNGTAVEFDQPVMIIE